MKVYLAGPMRGVPEWNFPLFRHVTWNLRKEGYEVISPVELDETDHDLGKTWGEYLGRDVEIIANWGVKGIVLLPNWEKSPGARLEASLGLILGLRFFEWDGDVSVMAYPADIALILYGQNIKEIK